MPQKIQLEQISLAADRPLVSDVSFTLRRGQVLALLGSSGCGKSLTCAAALGLLPPGVRQTAGRVLLDGIPVHGEQLRGATIATIMQNPRSAFNPLQTMAAHARETCRAAGRETNDAVLLAAMEEVGLDNPRALLKRYPFEMSGGMLQRMMVALALLSRAPFIIADEPTTALDVTVQAQVLELLKDLQKELNTAILLITHNLGVVWEMCDTVMVMYAGNTVEYADTKTLYQEPLHPYTWGLLDSMPKLSSSAKEDLKTIPGTPPDLRLTGYCCNFYNRCPYATEICKNQVPPLKEVAPGHFVACHRQDGEHRLTRGEVNETCRKM